MEKQTTDDNTPRPRPGRTKPARPPHAPRTPGQEHSIYAFLGLGRSIATENGDFMMFALLLREDSPDRWDLLTPANWLRPNREEDWDFVVEEVRRCLTREEVLTLSRFVLLEPDNPIAIAIQQAVHVEHGLTEVLNSAVDGLGFRHAFIITSSRNGRRQMGTPAGK